MQSKLDGIQQIFIYFDSIDSTKYDAQLKSHIAKYLTVLISGVYEDIIENFFTEYLERERVSNAISQYISKTIDRSFRNPKIENIKDLLKKFSDEWGKKIDSIEGKNKDALDSIVNNKNAIAHGRNCTVTYNEIKNYHERSKVVLKEINKIIVS